MARDVVFTARTKRPANVALRTKRRAGTDGLATALGAAEATPMPRAADTPLGFVALREEVMRALRSAGGRPGLPDTERRKIPVTETAWLAVSQAAERMAAPGFHPSPAQVASVILELAVRDMPQMARRVEQTLRAPTAPDC
jgi:hypothetical protein